jgi:tetratricopeptide (TPR) repeat protein
MGWGYPPLPKPSCEEEALFVRRILEFWRDREYSLADSQIEAFLNQFPSSRFTDHFLALRGDIALQEKKYEDALQLYHKINHAEFQKEIQLKKWQALYGLGRYVQLHNEIDASASDWMLLDDEPRFYLAEALFRLGVQENGSAFFGQAVPLFESLGQSELYASHAKLALAEIYRLEGDQRKAAAFYLDLAEHEQDEVILFHAAYQLLHCNSKEAGLILKKVALGHSQHSQDAACHWLLFLAENKEWDTLLEERELFLTRCGEAKLPLVYFYLGQISYEKKIYTQALEDLKKCIGSTLPPQHEKKALFTLLACAQELKQWEVCESCFDELITLFPEVQPQALFLLAYAYQKGEELGRALKLYERLLRQFPECDYSEQTRYARIALLACQKKYREAHEELLSFLQLYPQSQKKNELLRMAIDLTIRQVELGEDVFVQLADAMQQAIDANCFSSEEKRTYELLLAKAYLKIERVNAALQLLHRMEECDPLLLAHCYIKEGTSPDKVILYGEEALLKHSDEAKLHIYLFNAYLEISKESEEKEYTQKAADHLEAVIDSFPISLENRLWLAHYFARENPAKALPLLCSLMENENNIKRFDNQALLLADLYISQKKMLEAESVLEKVAQLQQKSEQEAKLKLAQIYVAKGEKMRAGELFKELEDSTQLAVAYAARLQLARLECAANPMGALKKFEELVLRKSLASEPVHLEAAIDYAELKASLYPPSERAMRYLELLAHVKETFTQQEDIWSKDYHASRELFPDKDMIYQAYMRYLDACIYQSQAQLTADPIEKKTKKSAARALFSTLRNGKYAVSNYIKERAVSAYEN